MTDNKPISDKAFICVQLTEMQYYCLSEMAKNDYRTLNDLVQILIYEGFQIRQFGHEMMVEKLEVDRDPDSQAPHQYYTDKEIQEFLKPNIK